MSTTPPAGRSVKIDQDERGGWSSDRPRRDGAPPRPADLSVRSRVLRPADLLRYSPGSLLVIASPVVAEAERFADRLIEDRASMLSVGKVRKLLTGRVPDEVLEARSAEMLDMAIQKRLDASESVVVTEGIDPEARERHVRAASKLRRPCHLILVEVARDEVDEEQHAALNKLRKDLDGGKLGSEGFNTALRLGPTSVGEVKRLVFRSLPKDD